ncbi:hypothetical protein EBZ80_15120 [bacterium]|nr:hypothetical protein [bacterium]
MKKTILVAFAVAATACGVQQHPVAATKSAGSAPELKKLEGAHAEALFAALEDAGITPDTVDGRVIIGATNLSAETIRCSIIVNATQDRRCEFENSGKILEVQNQEIARQAVDALESVKAFARSAIGATNYEAKDLVCSKAVGPQGAARCELLVSSDGQNNPDGSRHVEGPEARSLYLALESTGWQPDNLIDGIRVTGETQLSADYLHCKMISDRDFTKSCELGKNGESSQELGSKSLKESLVKFLDNIKAQVAPFAIGAVQYRIEELKCRKIELAEPTYECDYSKVY